MCGWRKHELCCPPALEPAPHGSPQCTAPFSSTLNSAHLCSFCKPPPHLIVQVTQIGLEKELTCTFPPQSNLRARIRSLGYVPLHPEELSLSVLPYQYFSFSSVVKLYPPKFSLAQQLLVSSAGDMLSYCLAACFSSPSNRTSGHKAYYMMQVIKN